MWCNGRAAIIIGCMAHEMHSISNGNRVTDQRKLDNYQTDYFFFPSLDRDLKKYQRHDNDHASFCTGSIQTHRLREEENENHLTKLIKTVFVSIFFVC